MKEIIKLNQKLHVCTRIPLGSSMSMGEFFSLMEGHVKEDFLHKIISEIKFDKQYMFTIKVVDVSNDYYYGIVEEIFEFTMSELDDDEVVAKKEDLELRRFLRW